jgi:polyhydroxyalkanoate synthesis regulator phasin
MAVIDDFLKAYVYFVESGLPEKLAKQLAESVTGAKADDKTLKAFEPEVKKQYGSKTPKKLATKKERGDINFITTKIPDPQKSDFVLQGLDGTTESLYSRFRLEKDSIKKGMIQQMNRAKENNMAISGKDLDNIIYNLKIYKSMDDKVNSLADELVDAGKEPEKIFKDFTGNFLNRKRSANEPFEKRLDEEYIKDEGIMKSLNESLDKMQKQIDEINEIKSGKKQDMERDQRKLKFQGKGYGEDSPIYRSLARQFLRDEIEAGRIETSQRIYNAMKTGSDPQIDAIKIFRHHYGDDAFDNISNYIDTTFNFDKGIQYPGRFEFRKRGIVVRNKKAPGNTYEHYSLPGEIDQEIREIDGVIENIQAGKNPLYKNKDEIVQGILEQNSRRANFVKVKNEITPASEIDLTKYSNNDLNKLAKEGNQLQKELAQLDQTGSSKIPYQEFQVKSARLDEINKIIDEAKLMPEEFFDQQPTAEIIQLKSPDMPAPDKRIIQPKNVRRDVMEVYEDLSGGANFAEGDTKYNADVLADAIALARGLDRNNISSEADIKLYGEAYDYLTEINRLNKKPDPQDFARGGIVEVLI